MEVQLPEYAEPRGGASSGVPIRGAVPAGDADARAQPRHDVVLGDRPRLAGIARRVRALARPGEFRCGRTTAAKPRELPIARRMIRAPERKPSLALLAAVTALAFSALHIVVQVLPILTVAFDDSPSRVQLVVTLFLAGIAAGQLLYGPISDRFGRRPVLLAGLMLFLAGTLLCGAAWSLPVLIIGRVFQALGACAGIMLGRAIIRDVYEREAAARGLAIVMMMMTLVPGISPAIGAYLAEWIDWRAIFTVLGALGAVVLAFTAICLPETNPNPARLDLIGMARSYATLGRSPEYVSFMLCGACSSAAWFTFCASAPYVLSDLLREPASTYGTMILLPMATYMLGSGLAARLAPRIGSLRLVLLGRGVAFVAASGMAVWWWIGGLGIWTLFVPITFTAIGDGLSQ